MSLPRLAGGMACVLALSACDASVDVRRSPADGGAPTDDGSSSGSGGGAAGGSGGAGGESCEGGPGTACEPTRQGLLFDGNAAATTLAIDSAGDVVIGGRFTDLELDRIVLRSIGEQDLYVAKLDGSTGAVRWVLPFGTPATDQRIAVAVDASDNVVVAGTVRAPIDFGGGPICEEGFGQIYLAKLSPVGEHLFSRCFGDPAVSNGGPSVRVATTASGEIVLFGASDDDIDLGTGMLPYWAGTLFVAKYHADGQASWARKYGAGDSPNAYSRALALDRLGNLFLAIAFDGVLDFEGLALESDEDFDALVAKLDPSGGLLWGTVLRGDFTDFDIAVGPDGGVACAGPSISRVETAGLQTSVDGFIVSLDEDGAPRWAAAPSTPPHRIQAIGVDEMGNVLAVSRLAPDQRPAGRDLGFAAFSPAGTLLAERNFGSGSPFDLDVRGDKLAFCGTASDEPGLDFGDGLLVSDAEYGAGVFTAWFDPWELALP